jgi:hypothetical protein
VALGSQRSTATREHAVSVRQFDAVADCFYLPAAHSATIDVAVTLETPQDDDRLPVLPPGRRSWCGLDAVEYRQLATSDYQSTRSSGGAAATVLWGINFYKPLYKDLSTQALAVHALRACTGATAGLLGQEPAAEPTDLHFINTRDLLRFAQRCAAGEARTLRLEFVFVANAGIHDLLSIATAITSSIIKQGDVLTYSLAELRAEYARLLGLARQRSLALVRGPSAPTFVDFLRAWTVESQALHLLHRGNTRGAVNLLPGVRAAMTRVFRSGRDFRVEDDDIEAAQPQVTDARYIAALLVREVRMRPRRLEQLHVTVAVDVHGREVRAHAPAPRARECPV